jgi:hypothetical protein
MVASSRRCAAHYGTSAVDRDRLVVILSGHRSQLPPLIGVSLDYALSIAPNSSRARSVAWASPISASGGVTARFMAVGHELVGFREVPHGENAPRNYRPGEEARARATKPVTTPRFLKACSQPGVKRFGTSP